MLCCDEISVEKMYFCKKLSVNKCDIIMERLVFQKLVDWKCGRNRKPLVLNGGRQVGKFCLCVFIDKLSYNS